MSRKTTEVELTLPEAAARLHIPYQRAYDLVLRGVLGARRNDAGRFLVSLRDVRVFAASRARSQADKSGGCNQ